MDFTRTPVAPQAIEGVTCDPLYGGVAIAMTTATTHKHTTDTSTSTSTTPKPTPPPTTTMTTTHHSAFESMQSLVYTHVFP